LILVFVTARRAREREMEEGCKGYVRADIKRLDEQLDKHINRVWAMKNDEKGKKIRVAAREDWEIDPDKLVVKQPIARGAFGTVHRGLYDGKHIAGLNFYAFFFFFFFFFLLQL
jgi:hypothetical protein